MKRNTKISVANSEQCEWFEDVDEVMMSWKSNCESEDESIRKIKWLETEKVEHLFLMNHWFQQDLYLLNDVMSSSSGCSSN